jgi:hypothetical protein
MIFIEIELKIIPKRKRINEKNQQKVCDR